MVEGPAVVEYAGPKAHWEREVGIKRRTAAALFYSLQPLMLTAVTFPAMVYMIRALKAEAWGQWTTATALTATVGVLTNLGLRGPFVRAVAQNPESGGEALAEQLGVRLVLSIAAGMVAVGAAAVMWWMGRYSLTTLECTMVAALAMVFTTMAATACDLLQALQRLTLVACVPLVSGVTLISAAVWAVWSGLGPVGVAGAYATGPILVVPLVLWVVHRNYYPVRISFKIQRSLSLLWGGRYFAFQQFIASGSQNIAALMVSGLLGAKPFGYFSAGSVPADRLTAIPDGLAGAAYPAAAQAAKKGGAAVMRVFWHYLGLALLVTVPAAVSVSLLARPIARLLFKEDPEICEVVILITIWLLPLTSVEYVLSYVLNALHKDAAQAKASLWGALHIVLAIVLVWKFGWVGACWAAVLRPVVRVAVILPCTVQTLGPLWRESRKGAAVEVAEVV